MDSFEARLNGLLSDVYNNVLKYEALSLNRMSAVPVTIREAHLVEAIGLKRGKATVGAIAASMGIAVPTATVAVKKLERKGLAVKYPCAADGRKSLITLTEAGARIYRAHTLFHKSMARNIGRKFPDAEKETLLAALERLNGFFKEKAGVRK